MEQNAINAYQRNAILTASPTELTTMLYDGAIKFCNIAKIAIEKKDIPKAHENLKRAQGETPNRFSLRDSRSSQPCRYLDLDSDLQNRETLSICFFKPLSLWYPVLMVLAS